MRIGLNLLYLIPGVVGGTETYARELIAGFRQIQPDHEFVVFVNRECAKWMDGEDSFFTKVVCPVDAVNRKKRYYFEQIKLNPYVKQYKIDLLHSLAYTSPLFPTCPAIVSLPDLNFKAFGDSMPLSRRLMLKLVVGQAVHRSSKVITISNFSRKEILKQYNIPPEKVVVTYLAAGGDASETMTFCGTKGTHPLPDLNQPYAMAFSSPTVNKNISRLIKAFLEAKRQYKLAQKLLLIGHPYPAGNGAQRAFAHEDVVWTGYLRQDALLQILRGADFMIFPSYYEGFGLPVLEAMAAGIPVVCSHAASLPEVAGDAGIYFDPFSIRNMAACIAQVATDRRLRDGLKEKGFNNLKRFSWEKTAAETIAVYDEILRNDPLSVHPHIYGFNL